MSAPAPGTSTLGQALSLIHTGIATRAQLTAELGLTRTAVSKLLAELTGHRLVAVDSRPAPEPATTGRPSHRLRPAATGPLVLATTITADAVTVALIGLGGQVERRVTRSLRAGATPPRVAAMVARQAASIATGVVRPVLGAGVAIESAVDARDGTALAALYLGWPPGVPLRTLVTDALRHTGLDVPVTVGNDAHCAALAEHRHGAGRGTRYLLYLASGPRGIGGALVVGGQLYEGRDGAALEIGHVIVRSGGRPCHCGNRGCLEVEAGPVAIVPAGDRRARRIGLEARAREIVAGAGTDRETAAMVRRAQARLGTGIAGLINVFNPDRIVLGGSVLSDLLAYQPPHLRDAVSRQTLLRSSGDVPLQAGHIADASLLGAAELALQPLLDDPRRALTEIATRSGR